MIKVVEIKNYVFADQCPQCRGYKIVARDKDRFFICHGCGHTLFSYIQKPFQRTLSIILQGTNIILGVVYFSRFFSSDVSANEYLYFLWPILYIFPVSFFAFVLNRRARNFKSLEK